jgi:hypothetical protein
MTAPATSPSESRTLPEAEPASNEVFHVEHRDSGTGEGVELARYSITDGGQRIVSSDRIDGHVRVVDRPAAAGRSFLVERELELDGPEAIDALVADYLHQAQKLDAIPMRTPPAVVV